MRNLIFQSTIILLLGGCVGDDLVDDRVDPMLRLSPRLESLAVSDMHSFSVVYLNEVGQAEDVEVSWASSDVTIATVDAEGVVTGQNAGSVEISATSTDSDMLMVADSFEVGTQTVLEVTGRGGSLQTSSSYTLQGDFTLDEEGQGLLLNFASNYVASDNLPGLFIYLTNNPNTTNGAYEIGPVSVYSGAHSYSLPSSVGIDDYSHVLYFCAPFNVKVGDGQLN